MKHRLLTYLFGAWFLFALALPVAAVEKKQAEKPATTKSAPAKKAAEKKVAPKKQPANSQARNQRSGSAGQRKFDSFVDKNKNGIDDRKERHRKVNKQVAPKKVDTKTKSSEQSKKKD